MKQLTATGNRLDTTKDDCKADLYPAELTSQRMCKLTSPLLYQGENNA